MSFERNIDANLNISSPWPQRHQWNPEQPVPCRIWVSGETMHAKFPGLCNFVIIVTEHSMTCEAILACFKPAASLVWHVIFGGEESHGPESTRGVKASWSLASWHRRVTTVQANSWDPHLGKVPSLRHLKADLRVIAESSGHRRLLNTINI